MRTGLSIAIPSHAPGRNRRWRPRRACAGPLPQKARHHLSNLRDAIQRLPKGRHALAPNALRVMDHIGVYDRLRTAGYNCEELTFTNGVGHVLGKFLNGSQKEYFPCIANPSGHCTGGADRETVEAEFVVGTDGIHSRIRPFIAPESTPQFSGLKGVMGTAIAENLQSLKDDHDLQLPAVLFGASGSLAITPASFNAEEVGYFATIEAQDRGREGWAKLESDKGELQKMLTDRFLSAKSSWPGLVKELCEKTPASTLTSWPFFSVPHLDSWSSPKKRIVIIGDSAHAIPPTGSQGAAMAFEDAETLAYVLSRVFASDFKVETLPEIFAKWDSPQRAHRQGHRLHHQERQSKEVESTLLQTGR